MKYLKKLTAMFLAAVLMLTVTACGTSSKYAEAGGSFAQSSAAAEMAAPAQAPAMDKAQMNSAGAENADGGGISNKTETASVQPTDSTRKLIRRVYMDAQTKTFDVLMAAVTKQVEQLGGYFETSSVKGGAGGGNSYMPVDAGAQMRYAHMVIRIPKDKTDELVSMINEQSNVVSKQETMEDITLNYVDVESRTKAFKIEQERLLVLLEKAEKIEDVIAIEARLSEVRYQLENYQSQLRTFDNLIDYSTVTLDVGEVLRVTPTEQKTLGSRMKNGLSQTMYDMGQGAQNLFVWVVVNLPYIVVWAVLAAIALVIIYKLSRRANKKIKNALLQPKSADDAEDGKENK